MPTEHRELYVEQHARLLDLALTTSQTCSARPMAQYVHTVSFAYLAHSEEPLKLEGRGSYVEAPTFLDAPIPCEKDQDKLPFVAGHNAVDLARVSRLDDVLSVTRSCWTEKPGGTT